MTIAKVLVARLHLVRETRRDAACSKNGRCSKRPREERGRLTSATTRNLTHRSTVLLSCSLLKIRLCVVRPTLVERSVW
jgi:hypothetical protein